MATECYRLTIQGIAAGEQCQNVLHFNCDNNDDTPPRTVAGELLAKWQLTFQSMWLQFQSEHYAIRWLEAKRVIPKNANAFWVEFPGGTADGSDTGAIAPLQTAPIVKLFAGLAVNVQGRVFLPPPGEGMVLANVVDSGYRSEVITLFDALISFSGTSHDFALAVLSRKLGNAHAVTTATVSEQIGMVKQRCRPL